MNEERILRQEVFKAQIAVDQALQRVTGKRLWKLKDPADQLRLLTLVIWSRKYRVSLDEILKILIGYYSSVTYKHARRTPLFGAPLPTLVGKFSETLLVEKLKKLYPEKQNERDWLQDQKDRQLKLLAKSAGEKSIAGPERFERIVRTGDTERFAGSESTIGKERVKQEASNVIGERVESNERNVHVKRNVSAVGTEASGLHSFLRDYDKTVKQKQKSLSGVSVLGRRRFRNSPW